MQSPDWHAALRARVEALPEPFRTYGLAQCEEALSTFFAFPQSATVIAWELGEIVESLEISNRQILEMPPGTHHSLLTQASQWLLV